MTEIEEQAVVLANGLTARWCGALGEGAGEDGREVRADGPRGFVVSGACTWPLLALLASVADGAAREELCAAVGIEASIAQRAGVGLLAVLEEAVSTSAAVGLWARTEVPIDASWAAGLPAGTVGALSGEASRDQEALDAWVRRYTNALVERMPVQVDEETRLLLASALAAKTRWVEPFTETFLMPSAGPWAGHRGPGLRRTTHDLSAVSILGEGSAPVTRLVVAGEGDLDVHLVIGDGTPGDVLGAGVKALGDGRRAVAAASLEIGTERPGLRIQKVASTDEQPRVAVELPAFDLHSDHDLLERGALFGLESATDTRRGHFPGLAPEPLAVGQARSSVIARFSAEGFEAAAVTAVEMLAGAMMPTRSHEVLELHLRFDRPFGFLAVHRPTGLAVVAGWIASPPPFPREALAPIPK